MAKTATVELAEPVEDAAPARPRPRSWLFVACAVVAVVVLGGIVVAVRHGRSDVRRRPMTDLGPIIQPPIVADPDRVYVFTPGGMDALDAGSLDTLWSRDDCPAAAADALHPVMFDAVIVRCLNSLTAVNREDGSAFWSVPIPLETERVRVSSTTIVVSGAGRVDVLDLGSGNLRWSRPIKNQGVTFAVDADRVYSTDADSVTAYDAHSGDSVWSHPARVAELYVDDHNLYESAVSRVLSMVDPTSGAVRVSDPKGDQRLFAARIIGTTPDRVVFVNRMGALFAFSSTDARFVWDFPPGDNAFREAAVAGPRAVATFGEDLYVIDLRDGHTSSKEPSASSLLAVGDRTMAYLERGDLVVRDL